jgi:hypothetical protein
MNLPIDSYLKIAKELKANYPTLTEFERLSLAIQIERNQLLENGLNISKNDRHPASLEAIAIALGYTDEQFKYTITDALKDRK